MYKVWVGSALITSPADALATADAARSWMNATVIIKHSLCDKKVGKHLVQPGFDVTRPCFFMTMNWHPIFPWSICGAFCEFNVSPIMIHHGMETFSAFLVLCDGNPPVTGGFPSQRASNAGFDVVFYVNRNKLMNTVELPVIWNVLIWHHIVNLNHWCTAYNIVHRLPLYIAYLYVDLALLFNKSEITKIFTVCMLKNGYRRKIKNKKWENTYIWKIIIFIKQL